MYYIYVCVYIYIVLICMHEFNIYMVQVPSSTPPSFSLFLLPLLSFFLLSPWDTHRTSIEKLHRTI